MSPRAHVYAAFAAVVLAVLPVASQGMGTGAPTVGVSVSLAGGATSVTTGTTISVTCTATVTSGSATSLGPSATLAADAGTIASPITVSGGASTVSGTGSWTIGTPTATTANVTCTVPFTYTSYSVNYSDSAVATVAFPVIQHIPPMFAADPYTVLPPAGPVLVGTAYDVKSLAVPSTGGSITYAWTATGGTIASPTSANTTWTAPAAGGVYTVKVTATDSLGASSYRSVDVSVAVSMFQDALDAKMNVPKRVAATPAGDLFVVADDPVGSFYMLTRSGKLLAAVALPYKATAVAANASTVFVSTAGNGILKLDPATGRIIGRLQVGSGATGLAWDPVKALLWVSNLGGAFAYDVNGVLAFSITQAANPTLFTYGVIDVAVDAAGGVVWVLEHSPSVGYFANAFSYGAAGMTWARAAAPVAGATLQMASGLVVGGGRIFVSDPMGNVVQAYAAADGSPLGPLAAPPTPADQLIFPRGLAFMGVNGADLAVANCLGGRINRYGAGVGLPLPTCTVNGKLDSDCDGMDDAWELLHGFNPNDASDALADADRDGLTNREEYQLGTDPRVWNDRSQLLAGTDVRPTVTVGSPGLVQPGIVRFNAVANAAASCTATAAWRQLSGPNVTLRNRDTFSPSFVARTAGAYKFEVVALCGTAASTPAVADLEVAQVAPVADAGRRLVVAPGGRAVSLSAGFSSDANGDTLRYSWLQLKPVDGPSNIVATRGAGLTVLPAREGYYEYQLTADDGVKQGTATVGLVVAGGTVPTAIVASPLITAAVGDVTLDASASLPADATFVWTEVEPAGGVVATTAAATVTIPSPGRYVFEVTATKGGVTSPPAQVVVLAGAVPTPDVSGTATAGTVNAPVSLVGATGVTNATFSWRQVAGPAAGLSGADAAVATATPFSPGVYLFELTVSDGTSVSAPARVRVDVTAPGKALPVAVASARSTAILNELVVLDGRASTGAPLSYHWSQVRGPWVAIDGASAAPFFTAPSTGTYEFELVVDDGKVRSAPAAVTVNVQ